MTNSFYLHYEDMKKMALVWWQQPRSFADRGQQLAHTPTFTHSWGGGGNRICDTKKKTNETDTDRSVLCGLVAP